MDAMTAPADLLRGAGLRVTAIRTAVIESVLERPHADAEHVRAGVLARVGSASVQSVYDALNVLSAHGVLRRIQPAGHPALYEVHLHDNHHHLACRSCGRVEDTPCPEERQPCLDAADDHGFALDEAEVVYWGLCPGCRQAAPAAS